MQSYSQLMVLEEKERERENINLIQSLSLYRLHNLKWQYLDTYKDTYAAVNILRRFYLNTYVIMIIKEEKIINLRGNKGETGKSWIGIV